MAAPPDAPARVTPGDAAGSARRLLDFFGVCQHAASALEQKLDTLDLPVRDERDIRAVIRAMNILHVQGPTFTRKISTIPFLIKGYSRLQASLDDQLFSRGTQDSIALQKVKRFLIDCEGKKRESSVLSTVDTNAGPLVKKAKRSDRVLARKLNTNAKSLSALDSKALSAPPEFTGEPPDGATFWTKRALISAIDELGVTSWRKPFLKKVVSVGKTHYLELNSIYRMYRNFKKTGHLQNGAGRPSLTLSQLEERARGSIDQRASDSNCFRLKDVKSALSSRKKDEAEKNGLDGDSIDVSVNDEWAKVSLTALALSDTKLSFTKKKLLKKTETRFIAEHSVMGAYAYAATVLSTHFIFGTRPTRLTKFHPGKMSHDAQETLAWMRLAYGDAQVDTQR